MVGNLRRQYDHARQSDQTRLGGKAAGPGPQAERKECLLTEELLSIMKENFERLDKYEDLVVPRSQLVEAIKQDVRTKKFLNKGVVYLPKVKKEISLRKVLNQIEQEEFIKADNLDTGDSNFISSKKYISWKNFMDYFVNYSRNQALPEIDLQLKKDDTDDQNLIEIPKSLKEKMKIIFNELKDNEGYVKSFEFLNRLKQDKLLISNMEVQIRTKAKFGEIPAETLRETLSRIEDFIDDYTDWEEFIQYFTKRGTPVAVELSKQVPQLTHVVAPTMDFPKNAVIDRSPKYGFNLTDPGVAHVAHQQPVGNRGVHQAPFIGMVFTDQGRNVDHQSHSYQSYEKFDNRKMDQFGGQRLNEVQVDDRTRLFDYRTGPKDGNIDLLAQTRYSYNQEMNPINPQPGFQGYQSGPLPPGFTEAVPLPPGFEDARPSHYNDELIYPSAEQDFIPRSYSAGALHQEQDDPYVIDDFVYYGDEAKRHKITVPTPLQFEAREHRRSQSTKYRKFNEYIEQKRREEEEALRFNFRAKSVPKAVKQPLYDKIMSVIAE
jgi:hypothetical protein